jgi:hypothetical protein
MNNNKHKGKSFRGKKAFKGKKSFLQLNFNLEYFFRIQSFKIDPVSLFLGRQFVRKSSFLLAGTLLFKDKNLPNVVRKPPSQPFWQTPNHPSNINIGSRIIRRPVCKHKLKKH